MTQRYFTTFIGRLPQMQALESWSEGVSRLATVISPGGFGKSRLLDQFVATRNADQPEVVVTWEDDRGSLSVLDSLLATLRLSEATRRSGVAPLQVLIDTLRRRGVGLVVLDGVEGSLQEARSIATSVLGELPDSKILITSRVALGLRGETWIQLSPLAVGEEGGDEAAQMLAARCAENGVEVAAKDAPLLDEIARRVDGVPLAIEMVAARLRLVSPATLLRVLEEGFAALGENSSSTNRKQASLLQVVNWSLEHLGNEERNAIAQLSLLTGAFTLESSATILGSGLSATMSVLESLYRAGLVQRFHDVGAGERFAIYAVVAERTRTSLEPDVRVQALARLIQGLLGGADDATRSVAEFVRLRGGLAELFQISDDAYDGIVVAFDDRVRAAILLGDIGDRWGWTGPITSRLESILRHPAFGDSATELQTRLRLLRGLTAVALADKEALREQLDFLKGIPLTGAPALELRCLEASWLAMCGRWEETEQLLVELLEDEDLRHPHTRLRAMMRLSAAQGARGKMADAVVTCKRATELAIAEEEWGLMAWAMILMTSALSDLGRLEEARDAMTDVDRLIAKYNLALRTSAYAAQTRAQVALQTGELGLALERAEKASAAFAASHDQNMSSASACLQVVACCLMGNWPLAIRKAEDNLFVSHVSLDSTNRVTLLGYLAVARAGQGDVPESKRFLDEVAAVDDLKPIFSKAREIHFLLHRLLDGVDQDSLIAELSHCTVGSPPVTVRFAAAAVERAIRSRAPQPGYVTLLRHSQTVRLPGGESVELTKSLTLRLLVELLVQKRVAWPGTPVSRDELIAAAWPEDGTDVSKKNRLRVAMATLRKSLPGCDIKHQDDGYLISTDVPTMIEP